MSNYVTQAELDAARETYKTMGGTAVSMLKDAIAEQRAERRAAIGGDGSLAPCVVEETGEPVSPLLYELCYRARVAKLFEERDSRRNK